MAEDIAESLERQGSHKVFPVGRQHAPRQTASAKKTVDMVWLNTGGVQGRSPMLHGSAMLEMMGVPYLGQDPRMSGILESKYAIKRNISHLGLPTAASSVSNPAWSGSADPRSYRRFQHAFGDFNGPFIVKPVSGRASLHIHVVHEAADLADAICAVYSATENDVLIETYLSNREYCIAVGGPVVSRLTCLDREGEPFEFSAAERVLADDERIFTSMDQRPISGDRISVLNAYVDGLLINELETIARSVYEDMRLGFVIRLDIWADANDKLFILEANPVCHQMIWGYFGLDLAEDWSHLIVDDYATAFR